MHARGALDERVAYEKEEQKKKQTSSKLVKRKWKVKQKRKMTI